MSAAIDDLMTTAQVAVLLQLSPGTLANWRSTGVGPRHVKVNGRTVRYRRSDVIAWSESNGWVWSP